MSNIKLFESNQVRTTWSEAEEKWYFSVLDVLEVLTDQPTLDRARNYWKALKKKLIDGKNELVTNCNRLKLHAQELAKGWVQFVPTLTIETSGGNQVYKFRI